MKASRVALVIVLLLSAYATVRNRQPVHLRDFQVYYTAGRLVRLHRSAEIYAAADKTVLLGDLRVDPRSGFAAEARSAGIGRILRYIYPPTLADLMVPFAYLTEAHAEKIWNITQLLMLAASFVVIWKTLRIGRQFAGALALLAGILAFGPIWQGFELGQVLILLLLMLAASVFFYRKDWKVASALSLAVATAIKLTPLIVIAPLLILRDWKWLRFYCCALLALFLAVLCVNGPHCLQEYFFNVMPQLGSGYASPINWAIISNVKQIYTASVGGDPRAWGVAYTPVAISFAAKLICTGVIAIALALLMKNRRSRYPTDPSLCIALFAILSVPLSPISWIHAYTICLLGFAMLWAEAVRFGATKKYLLLLSVASLECNSFLFTTKLRAHLHGVAFGLAGFIPTLLAIALVYYRLADSEGFGSLQIESDYPPSPVELTPSAALA